MNELDKCQRCNEEVEDIRTLEMNCEYNMSELNIPFYHYEPKKTAFSLDVCKECRADWLDYIDLWFKNNPRIKSCGSGIFIRHLGGTFEITEDHFRYLYPDREPVRVKNG